MADHVRLARSVPEGCGGGGPWQGRGEVAVCAGVVGGGQLLKASFRLGHILTSNPLNPSQAFSIICPPQPLLTPPGLPSALQQLPTKLHQCQKAPPTHPPTLGWWKDEGWVNMKQNWSHNAAHKGQTLHALILWKNYSKWKGWLCRLLSTDTRSQFP